MQNANGISKLKTHFRESPKHQGWIINCKVRCWWHHLTVAEVRNEWYRYILLVINLVYYNRHTHSTRTDSFFFVLSKSYIFKKYFVSEKNRPVFFPLNSSTKFLVIGRSARASRNTLTDCIRSGNSRFVVVHLSTKKEKGKPWAVDEHILRPQKHRSSFSISSYSKSI